LDFFNAFSHNPLPSRAFWQIVEILRNRPSNRIETIFGCNVSNEHGFSIGATKIHDIMGFKTYTSCLTSVAKLETNVSPKSALQKTGRKFWISAHQIMLKRQKRLLEEGACVAFSVFSTKSFHPFLKSGKNTTFAMGPCLLHSTQNCS